MQILFLLTQDLESPYGIGRYLPLARAMTRLGHQMSVAALHSDFEALPEKRFDIDGIKVHYVAPMHVMKRANQKSYYRPHQLIGVALRATLALSWAALNSSADIIYVGKPHPMNSIAGLLAQTLRRKPMTVDCDDYEAGSGHFTGAWQKKTIEIFEKNIPRLAQKVSTHTDFMRANLISWGVPPEKVFYLPNGIDPERFTPPDPARVEAERERLKLKGKKVVAYIGSVSMPSHPVNLLVEAFAQIHQKMRDTVLVIVGGGDDLVNLQKQAVELGLEEVTRFVGRVPPDDIPLYYALADVSSDPVHDDDIARGRCPMKLFESWACNVPFVTADVGDRRKLIGDPPAGALARPGDVTSLARVILDVLSDSATMQAYLQQGQVRVKDYYWDQLALKLAALEKTR